MSGLRRRAAVAVLTIGLAASLSACNGAEVEQGARTAGKIVDGASHSQGGLSAGQKAGAGAVGGGGAVVGGYCASSSCP